MGKNKDISAEIKRLAKVAESSGDEQLSILAAAVQDNSVREAISDRVARKNIYDGALISKAKDGSYSVDFIFRRSAKSSFSLVPPRFRAVVEADGKTVGRVTSPVGFEQSDDMVSATPNFSLDRLFVNPELDLAGAAATYANGPTTYWV